MLREKIKSFLENAVFAIHKIIEEEVTSLSQELQIQEGEIERLKAEIESLEDELITLRRYRDHFEVRREL